MAGFVTAYLIQTYYTYTTSALKNMVITPRYLIPIVPVMVFGMAESTPRLWRRWLQAATRPAATRSGPPREGIEADLFFTFFGLDAIRKDRYEKIKVATVGNPGMHLPTWIGALPGFSALATRMMTRQMEKIDIPPIPEFIELVADSGAHLYACKATVDMFGLTMEDFVPQVDEIISVGEFYEKAAGGQIIFT